MTGKVRIEADDGHAWHGRELAVLDRSPGRIATQIGTFLLRGYTWQHSAFPDGSVTCVLLNDPTPAVPKRSVREVM